MCVCGGGGGNKDFFKKNQKAQKRNKREMHGYLCQHMIFFHISKLIDSVLFTEVNRTKAQDPWTHHNSSTME